MLRKNVASQNIAAQLIAKADGTPITSGTTTVYVTIDGGTQNSGGGTVTHKGNGSWNYAPTQAETNGNHVAFTFANSNAVNVTLNVYPVSYDPTDSVRMGLTALPNATAGGSGGVPTVDASNYVAGIQGTKNQLDDLNDLSAATVKTQADTALTDIHLDHLLAVDYDPASKPGTATALLNELVESDAGVSRFTANALEQAPTGGSAPTAAEIADAVWDESLADHNTEDSFGNVLNDLVDEDGGGVYQFNVNALENAPTGSGGVADWSAGEKEQIRYRLQLDGTQTAPATDAPLQMPVSADAISQDAAAADNLEAMLDGTRAKLYLSQLDIEATGDDDAIKLVGSGNGHGINSKGGASGNGCQYEGGDTAGIGLNILGINATGLYIQGNEGVRITGNTSNGLSIFCNNVSSYGIGVESDNIGIYVGGFGGDAVHLEGLAGDGLKIAGSVNDINADITGNLSGSIGSLATQAKADVNAEVAAQLVAKKLDLLLSAASIFADDVTAGSIIDQLADDGTAQFDRTTDSLQAIADNAGGASLTAQEVRNAMELASTAGATAEGSIDYQLVGLADKIGTPVALDGGAATVGGMLTKLADDSNGSVYNAETDSQTAIAAGGGGLSAQEVRNAMELASTAGATAEGSIDYQIVGLADKIGTPVALDGGAATVGGMLTKLADDSNGSVYNAETDSQTAIAAGGALDDTLPELTSGEPPATPTLKQAIMLLYMALRNASSTVKTGDNTGTRQIKNNAGTVIADADVSDDGTTFTQGKLGAP